MNYGFNTPCAGPPSSGTSGFFGLGATAAQRRAATAQKQQQRKAAAAQRRNVRVAGRNVNTAHPQAAAAIAQQVAQMQSGFKSVMARANSAKQSVATANAAKAAVARARTPQQRQSAQMAATRAHAVAVAAVNSVTSAAKPLLAQLSASHGGLPNPAQHPVIRTATRALRGLGVIDPNTGLDDGTGDPSTDPSLITGDAGAGYQQPYVDPSQGGYYPPPYNQNPVSTISPLDTTGLIPGFGAGIMPQLPTPAGCNTGSNLPRCLIFAMAQSEQTQFQFVFTVMQQMYAQLLQIVQQLMQQLQSAQQQPPYGTYGQYGQPPYGQDPYGGQYGAPGAYPGPYGYPGVPYAPGGDSSMIPPGYDDGGGGGIPTDISQVFPGPGPYAGPNGPGPAAPNLVSSDSLPDGSGPSTGGGYDGGDDAGNLVSQQQPMQAPTPNVPQSQAVSAGPNQPQIIVLQSAPGQAAYADSGLPAGPVQVQPELEPPSNVEDWASSDV